MITQPNDRLIKNFKIVAVIIGISLAYATYSWIDILYNVPSYDILKRSYTIWIVMAVMVFGIAAYIQFLATKFKQSKLLRLFLFHSCFSNLIGLCCYTIMFVSGQYSEMEDKKLVKIFVSVGGFIVADFISLVLLQKARVPKLDAEDVGGEKKYTFLPIKKGQRFIHRLLDLFVMLYIVNIYGSMLARVLHSTALLLVADFLMIFMYYFLMESIFKVTFGKIMTDSIVVNERGEKVKSARVLLRTFCRFIPFDALSFLFTDRGWHDRLSNTYVINDQYSWEDNEDAFDTYFTGEPESEAATTLIP